MRVKICGLTNAADALYAAEAGADILGFVFAESPRKVSPENVYGILNELERRGLRKRIECVGVFVNAANNFIEDIFRLTALDTAQLHGDESVRYTQRLKVPWYKALRFKTINDVTRANWNWNSTRILIDARVDNAYGGTGIRIPTETLLAAKDRAQQAGFEFFAAGGLHPGNIAEMIRQVKPDGVDISSGVEERPGKKSPRKIDQLLKEVRQALC